MELLMVLKGLPLAVVPLNSQRWHHPAYIVHLKHGLLKTYADLIEQSGEEPQFFIEGVGSCFNGFQSLLSRDGTGTVNDLLHAVLTPS
jgi:hypothetical protein